MKTPTYRKLGAAFAGAILLGALATLPAHAQTYPSIIQSNSPSDWWRFDESTTSPVVNTIANSGSGGGGAIGTGYVVGGVTLGQPGVVGSSALFVNSGGTGNCSARIDILNSPAFNPEPPFSVEFWVLPHSTTIDASGIGTSPVSSISVYGSDTPIGARSGYLFYVQPTTLQMRIGGLQSYSAICSANITLPTNTFTHVVGEFDGSTVYLYLNGVLATATPVTGGPFHPNTLFPTRIGGTSIGGSEYEDANGSAVEGSGNRGWDGWVDEFAVYNTLLSSNTVMAHYTAGSSSPSTYHALVLASSPVGYWDLDESAYTTPSVTNTIAADSGSLADLGTNTLGAVDDQPGVPGTGDKSVFYNGALGSLVLDTATTNLLDVAGQQISLVAWINPLSFEDIEDIIAQGYDETTYSENFLRVGDSFDWAYFQDDSSGGNYNPAVVPGGVYYEVGAFTGGAPGYVSAVFPAPPGDIGHWVFLVGTYDGTNWNLYRNGSLAASFTDPLALGPAEVDLPWAVGSRSNPNPYFGMFFAGSIAEPAIFTNALDAATISNLYQSATLPAVITEPPIAPSPAYLGSSAELTVLGEGPGILTYQWFSNNVAIAGQTATNLSLTGLTAAADATYSVVVTNAFGSATSSVVLVVTPTLPPAVLVPAVETRWLGFPLSFAPASLPNQTLSFQWDFNGGPISGATESSYTAPANSGTAGSYSLVLSNSFGVSTSTVSTLSLITAPNNYVSTILADQPLSYFRLDESGPPIAYDDAGGNNGTYFGSLTFGVPGYSLIDTDTAVLFPGTPLNYVGGIGPTTINFFGPSAEFSIEAWANGPAAQITGAAVVAKGHGNNGTTANEQFALVVDSGFYTFFVRDSKANAASATAKTGPDGNWHHLVGVCDMAGGNVTLYIDGAVAGTAGTGSLDAAGIINQEVATSIGSESSDPGPSFDLAYDGTISQVAIYQTNLSAIQVSNHYAAAYGTNLAPFITTEPESVTGYVTFPLSVSVQAAGSVPLTYQWSQNNAPISGATARTYTVASPSSADNGTYTVTIANGVGTTSSVPVTMTVLSVPTTPPDISGLVLHLTFDDTLADSSGRGNDATNEASGGAPLVTNNYVVGQIGDAFTYQTTVDTNTGTATTNANYASLGVRPDLQFGADVSFTVSMWIQLPPGYGLPSSSLFGNDLPFFTDTVNSTFGAGFVFAPSFGGPGGTVGAWPDSWAYSIFNTADSAGVGAYGVQKLFYDGNFHNLVYVVDRTAAGVTVYFDGAPAVQTAVGAQANLSTIGSINTTNVATIGQDPTGLYAQNGTAAIDDLGVWARALSKVEAESIFLAGSQNQLSFTSTPLTFSLQEIHTSGTQLQLTWGGGALQSATSLTGPWTAVAGATSPYVVTPTNTHEFYRVKF